MMLDPMKLAIVKTIAKENGMSFCELDNTCYLVIGKISYWITAKGNIRYTNPEHEHIMDLCDFKSNGDPLDTVIFLMKNSQQKTLEV